MDDLTLTVFGGTHHGRMITISVLAQISSLVVLGTVKNDFICREVIRVINSKLLDTL